MSHQLRLISHPLPSRLYYRYASQTTDFVLKEDKHGPYSYRLQYQTLLPRQSPSRFKATWPRPVSLRFRSPGPLLCRRWIAGCSAQRRIFCHTQLLLQEPVTVPPLEGDGCSDERCTPHLLLSARPSFLLDHPPGPGGCHTYIMENYDEKLIYAAT